MKVINFFFMLLLLWNTILQAGADERRTTADFVMGACSEEVTGEDIKTSCDEMSGGAGNAANLEGVSSYCSGCKDQMAEKYSQQTETDF